MVYNYVYHCFLPSDSLQVLAMSMNLRINVLGARGVGKSGELEKQIILVALSFKIHLVEIKSEHTEKRRKGIYIHTK